MAKEKQVIKRLTFTEDEAEQTLLATAEASVAAGNFPTFTDLCKAALQAFLSPAAVSQQSITPATGMMTGQLEQIEQAFGALQASQQEMLTILQQAFAQTATPALEIADVATARLPEQVEQLAQDVAEMRASQRDLYAIVQQIAKQMAAAETKQTQEPNAVAHILRDVQTGQQAMQAEVRDLAESLTAELAKLQVKQAPVNGLHQPVATEATQADRALSQETVNRLARFLEDF